MPYDEVSRWPARIDSFPVLADNVTPTVDDSEVLWAQHYNKIRSVVYNTQKYWTGVSVASGDGSMNSISMGMKITTPIDVLSQIVVKGAYLPGNKTVQNIPGNTLPFEFVYTTSEDDYVRWKGAQSQGNQTISVKLFVQEEAEYFTRFLGQSFAGNYPVVTCTLYDEDSGGYGYCPPLMAKAWAIMGTDTLIVRGFVLDLEANAGGQYERWDQYSPVNLTCSIILCSVIN